MRSVVTTLAKKEKKPKKPNLNKLCLVPEDPSGACPDRPLCQRCTLFREAKTPFMQPTVPEGWTGRLLVIGERPGQDEDKRTGAQFTGPSGRLLRKWLAEKGFSAQDVAYHNATMCGGPDNRTPSMEQIKCCRPFLLGVVNKLSPRTVLGVGGSALKGLTNDGGATVTRSRGRLLEVPQNPVDNEGGDTV